MIKIIFILIICTLFLESCNTVRDSAGVNRKVIDEYTVIENPPLVIPPDFNVLPPEQMDSKNIQDTDSELAKEILFGLDNNQSQTNNENSLILVNFSSSSLIISLLLSNSLISRIISFATSEFDQKSDSSLLSFNF